jgi:hypothetical protein
MIEKISLIATSDIGETLELQSDPEQVEQVLLSEASRKVNEMLYEIGKTKDTELSQSLLFGFITELKRLVADVKKNNVN